LIIDSEIAEKCASTSSRGHSPIASRNVKPFHARLLASCTKDPITLSDVGNHITCLKGASNVQKRMDVLQKLQSLGLGEVCSGRRLPNNPDSARALDFYRHPWSPAIGAVLRDLSVPESLWPTKQDPPLQDDDARLPPMAGAGRRGRPVHEETPYTVTNSLVVELGFENKQAFLEHERQWASTLLPNKVLNIRFQWYDYKAGFKALLWCNSCTECQNKGGWKGYSVYTLATKKLERAYTPVEKHGETAHQGVDTVDQHHRERPQTICGQSRPLHKPRFGKGG